MERERVLAPALRNENRARMETSNTTYTVAPRSTFGGNDEGASARPIGASGMEAFRKMTQKGKKRS